MISSILNSKAISVRFIISLIAGGARAGIGFTTAMLLARWLGPSEYGRLLFLIASHIAIRQFLDMGTSAAYFTFLSQRNRSRYFILVFWLWIFFQFLVLFILIAFIFPDNIIAKIWSDEERGLLLLAMVSSFVQGTVWHCAAQMGEAARETAKVQLAGLVALAVHLLLVITAWLTDVLSIELIFILVIIEWVFASVFVYKLYHSEEDPSLVGKMEVESFSSIFHEYKYYCIPLIPLTWLGATHDFADRWMLQTWSGAKEQAFFGVATQISAVSLLVTTAILRIFWKEIAEANEDKNYAKMGDLYHKLSKMLFFLGAFIAAAIMPWASEILFFAVGKDYVEGAFTFSLMLIYPIHQSLGQITNTMFYASNNTKLLMLVNGAFLIIGMGLAYLVLAPTTMYLPGYNLGSSGLAIKLIVMQLIFVNISSWVLSKKFKWPFFWSYQLKIILVCFIISQAVYALISLEYFDGLLWTVRLVIFSLLYFLIIAFIAAKNSTEVGVERDLLLSLLIQMKGKSAGFLKRLM